MRLDWRQKENRILAETEIEAVTGGAVKRVVISVAVTPMEFPATPYAAVAAARPPGAPANAGALWLTTVHSDTPGIFRGCLTDPKTWLAARDNFERYTTSISLEAAVKAAERAAAECAAVNADAVERFRQAEVRNREKARAQAEEIRKFLESRKPEARQ